ncbi:MAG TPA: methylenetetrahydrofolate--tRNA-(uracil(54)-C(5))-methyltransferase (FADH(2)-oxidizing) TrmFO [Fimbriimonadaceae bacterium]|nr:methylenetetrahydrofolate--tRNA-(uracil(54)-C(5))-methyltransferase (FADH(2)-oxidizing) TrmFO [Fimbriimonadaceae bacterium]
MITVAGAGFAGVEAAWAAAERGENVRLYEMRPAKTTPAHVTGWFAELVCSNSLKSNSPASPAGQLKAEMAALGSLVLQTAQRHSVPGGQALAVDREAFGRAITKKIEDHPRIEVVREEFTPAMAEEASKFGPLILATGPLTPPDLAEWLARLTGRSHLYFYDAVSPTVEASSLNFEVVFAQSRYDKGEGDDYLNCPFDRDSYEAFVRELVAAERAPVHAFEAGGKRTSTPDPSPGLQAARAGGMEEGEFIEKIQYFSGCTPIEAIAEKGARSLAFGNFKPVGLTDPRTGRRPWAALQLRPENREKSLYSLVACQTRLKWGEQKRIFRMVPGLEHAEFVRYGVIHRNTYIEAPRVLTPFLEMKPQPGLYVAGQLTGVEGYVESAAMGIYAGIVAASRSSGADIEPPPRPTAFGSLLAHLRDQTPREFSPMNINWGLFPEPDEATRDKGVKRAKKLEAARTAFAEWLAGMCGCAPGSQAERASS